MRLCWSHIPHYWKSYALAHIQVHFRPDFIMEAITINPDQAAQLRKVNGKRHKLSDMTTNCIFCLSEVKTARFSLQAK